MFIIGTTEKQEQDISLSTRKGHPIANKVEHPGDRKLLRIQEDEFFRSMSTMIGIRLQKIQDPDLSYNCVGMALQARRVFVHPDQIQKIFDDDGFLQVKPEDVRVGDTVTWEDEEKDYTHIGIVVEIQTLTSQGGPRLPRVLSKWGGLGEYLHAVQAVPAVYGTIVKYWRVSRDA